VSTRRLPLVLLVVFLILLAVSAVRPFTYSIWALEVFPAVLALPLLLATYRRFPLTNLLYALIFMHAVILIVGGHYSYARVPLGGWMQQVFHLQRNDYDRIGHFAQGFVPAMVAREILLRLRVVRGKGWLFFLVACIALAISASYELLEWAVAVISKTNADAFLATQGDPWDTQEDMATAAVGAVLAQLLLSGWHDHQLRKYVEQG
jgi:putative membrane protein